MVMISLHMHIQRGCKFAAGSRFAPGVFLHEHAHEHALDM